ncbi:MAG: tRNA (N6-threonylcarbamoyladenosine(37)-N6)-methyltransferase TrmO [Nitrospirota bacterium]|jgi:tRNA-Thr(GGU) m(6)t(6)A37 methyltransferase TsaA
MSDIAFRPIGTIYSPYASTADMPIQPRGALGIAGRVEVLPELAEGLKDLSGFSHIYLLYHFHKTTEMRLSVVPFLDSQARGVFATRAPTRPNPLGLSVVRLREVRGNVLMVENVDVLDGTPLLDIKPYVPAFDHWDVESTGWLAHRGLQAQATKSDERFTE